MKAGWKHVLTEEKVTCNDTTLQKHYCHSLFTHLCKERMESKSKNEREPLAPNKISTPQQNTISEIFKLWVYTFPISILL